MSGAAGRSPDLSGLNRPLLLTYTAIDCGCSRSGTFPGQPSSRPEKGPPSLLAAPLAVLGVQPGGRGRGAEAAVLSDDGLGSSTHQPLSHSREISPNSREGWEMAELRVHDLMLCDKLPQNLLA